MMRTADMTMKAIDVRGTLERTTEEVRRAEQGIKAKVAAAVKFLFCAENTEKPYGLDLSPAMKARLAL